MNTLLMNLTKNYKMNLNERRQINEKSINYSGITGQDGSYLTEFLLKKGYEVHGIIRRASTFNTKKNRSFVCNPG